MNNCYDKSYRNISDLKYQFSSTMVFQIGYDGATRTNMMTRSTKLKIHYPMENIPPQLEEILNPLVGKTSFPYYERFTGAENEVYIPQGSESGGPKIRNPTRPPLFRHFRFQSGNLNASGWFAQRSDGPR
ncbi:hypothetical protein TNCT_448211 [Trichonephila clavata]|uniref:Uncharacterized protein n=1 Tax=Trichonephila clavata TaxID=2740835 RepID=A0A8X6GMD0_TRICU|nr:hypothetical protein TNCT_448211 [Trichonephila clavata]